MSKWKKSAGAVAAATAFFWGSAAYYVPAPASAVRCPAEAAGKT